MEVAYLILGTVALWAFIATRTTNPFLRQFMLLETMLMTVAMGWIGWFAVDQTELVAMELWRYVVSIGFLAWIGVYGVLWITGALEKEELDNGF